MMHRPTISRLTIIGCLLMLAAVMPVLPAKGQAGAILPNSDDGNRKVKVSTAPVRVFGSQTIIYGAGSLLVRTRDGAYMSYHSFGLTPGTVVSVWWVFFNNPRACAADICTPADLMNPEVQGSVVSAAARIVGADGTAEFGAYRAIGDTTGARDGPGLLNAFKAQIHLVVRLHGPALDDPALLSQQLSSFNGGCPPNACANIQASVHEP